MVIWHAIPDKGQLLPLKMSLNVDWPNFIVVPASKQADVILFKLLQMTFLNVP
jgi:hypothetical protein